MIKIRLHSVWQIHYLLGKRYLMSLTFHEWSECQTLTILWDWLDTEKSKSLTTADSKVEAKEADQSFWQYHRTGGRRKKKFRAKQRINTSHFSSECLSSLSQKQSKFKYTSQSEEWRTFIQVYHRLCCCLAYLPDIK